MSEPVGGWPRESKEAAYLALVAHEKDWRACRRRFTVRVLFFAVAALGVPGAVLTLLLDNTSDGWTGLGLGLLVGWGYGLIGSWSWAAKYYRH
jgi:hypothetical protein